MHVLPRVRQLHERFEGSLEVIGIHAGKFPGERRTDRIADACERLWVEHPVMNDRQFRVWHDYGVKAWPTVALIDMEGYLVGVQAGEFDVDAMADVIARVIARGRERQTLKPAVGGPPPARERPRGAGPLRFPTRAVCTDRRLFVSDTGNRRVLECRLDADLKHAQVVREYAGLVEPRGLVVDGATAWVADRAGQAVWRLRAGERSLVAGTERLGKRQVEEGPGLETDLRSPWGLTLSEEGLVIAMAGSHQIWQLGKRDGRLTLLAGLGPEEIGDGRAREALLAQPTGVTRMSGGVAFSDCETSSVRLLSSGEDHREVRTLVGTGLFDFGDRDGTGDEVLLQHCEDVAYFEAHLSVADTYNDRLKMLDVGTRECRPWPGEAGEGTGLREPAGVCSAGDRVIVCDTGNHRLVTVDRAGIMEEVEFL